MKIKIIFIQWDQYQYYLNYRINFQNMGTSSSQQNFELLIIIYPNFQTQATNQFKLLNSYPFIRYQFFDSIQDAFQKKSEYQLRNILTNNRFKNEVIKKVIKHHLTKTRLYVYTKQQDITQQDFDNIYITTITSDFERIINHMQLNIKTQIYMPLYKIKLQTQKKINIKIIDHRISENIYQDRIKSMNDLHLSYELYESIQKFENSILLNKSDYVISAQQYINQVMQILKNNYKNFNVICLTKKQKIVQLFGKQIKIEQNFDQILKIIDKDTKKSGCSTLPKDQILVFNKVSKYKQKNSEKKILLQKLKQNYPELKFKIYENYEKELQKSFQKMFEQIKKNKYSTILFLQNINSIKLLKKKIKARNYHNRIIIETLNSETIQDKLLEFQKLQKFYFIQRRKPRSIDFINKKITSDLLIPHKRQIALNHLGYQQFVSLDLFKQKYERYEQFFKPYAICNYSLLAELKNYLLIKFNDLNYNNCKIICFDNKQKISLFKKQCVFDKNPVVAIGSSNIRQIIQYVKSTKVQYLISQNITTQTYFNKFSILQKKLNSCITSNQNMDKIMISPFPTNENDFFCKEELGFISSQNQQNLDSFIKQLITYWSLNLNPFTDFENFKSELKDLLFFCLQNQIIKTTTQSFEFLYINKIDQCKTIFQLLKAGIYIYTLPHGLSQCVSKLFIQYKTNLLTLKKFSCFILILILNFCSIFSDTKIFKLKLKVFIENKINFQQFKQNSFIYNINFLNCIESRSNEQCTKDHIQIEYQYYPLRQMDYYNSLLFIQPNSFYKESFSHMFAPYNKFYVKGQRVINQRIVLQLKCIHKNTYVNNFLQKIFEVQSFENYLTVELKKQKQLMSLDQNLKVQNIMNYHKFFRAIQNRFFYKAQNFLQLIQKNFQPNYINSVQAQQSLIDLIWLEINRGKYDSSKKKLKQFSNNCQFYLKEIAFNLIQLIEDIEHKRQRILRQKQQITNNELDRQQEGQIKWTCQYQQKIDKFVLKKQNQSDYYHETYENLCFQKKLQQEQIQENCDVYGKSNLAYQFIKRQIINVKQQKDSFRQKIINITTQFLNNQDLIQQNEQLQQKLQNLEAQLTKFENVQDIINFQDYESTKKLKWNCKYNGENFILYGNETKKKHLKIKKKKKITQRFY